MIFDWKLKQTEAVFDRIRKEEDHRIPKQKILITLLFLFLLLTAELAASFVRSIIRNTFFTEESYVSPARLLVLMYTTLISTLVVLFGVRLIERRSFRTMGLTRHHMLRNYAAGGVLGFAMIAAAFLLQVAAGALYNTGAAPTLPNLAGILLIFGWMLQGFNEELIFRGWLMMSVGTVSKAWTAVIYSSVFFMLFHLGNDGISPLACLNLTLFGIVTALLILRTDSIWAASAMHSAWNWGQGNFFGCKVSGIDPGVSVLKFAHSNAPDILTGGSFGPEGSILTTAVLIPVAILLLFSRRGSGAANDLKQATPA